MKTSGDESKTLEQERKSLLMLREAVELLDKNPEKSLAITSSLLASSDKNPLVWVVNGRAFAKLGQESEAESAFNKALSIDAHFDEALNGKAELFFRSERFDEAESLLTEAIQYLSPKDAFKYRSLRAAVYQQLKKHDLAVNEYVELTRQQPDNDVLWSNFGMLYQGLADFKNMHAAYDKAIDLSANHTTPYFNKIVGAHYDPDSSAESILNLCKQWQAEFLPTLQVARTESADLNPNRKLRIGLISDGFRSHPVGNMITLGLSHVPDAHIEIYAYSTNFKEDHITNKIISLSKKWQVIDGLSDDTISQQIREDNIDILFDLCGYNANSKTLVFMMQPAPIQIKWVGGLISSTGLAGMDYLLSDYIETPENVDDLYSEKLIRLPGDYICYDPPYYLPSVSQGPVHANGFITFGCFNNGSKVNDQLLIQWAKLLQLVPNSRLFLKSANFEVHAMCERVWCTLESNGITRDRVILEGRSPHRELLDSYNRVDIALDPWPYSGGLTTCEAMAMGVPVVTLPGPTFAGRHSASHLVNAGMPELVADSWEKYINIAVGLTNDLDSLSIIRQHLRDILLASPVCDGRLFAQHFSDAMRAVWQRYCEGKKPEALFLSNDAAPYFLDDMKPLHLQHPQIIKDQKLKSHDQGFEFQISGKVLMMDYGGVFARGRKFINLTENNVLHTVIMDPLSAVNESNLPLRKKDIQHVKGHLLGDGGERPFYMCLDARYSSDLKTLDSTSGSDEWTAQRVLTEVNFPSSKLDDIHGLDRLEWFSVDNSLDLKAVFSHGKRVLTSCLFINVQYRFEQTHKDQLSFSEIEEIMKELGFCFHAFTDVEYAQPVMINVQKSLPSSKMISAQILFIPTTQRMNHLSFEQREKLAFILHAGYQMHDVVAQVLKISSVERAKLYADEAIPAAKSDSLNGIKVPLHSLPQKLIVSLTSYHKRFATLHMTLQCLINQSVRPDRIVLWIAESERAIVPDDVLKFKSKGVEIKYCGDIKSYKKIVPMLVEDANAFIVTADDDLAYQSDWLEKIVSAWDGDYKTVVAYRAHKARLDSAGMPVDYKEWEWQYSDSSVRSGLIFPTTGFGTLYPPHCFHHDVTDEKLFEKLAPQTDDIWLYWMCRLNGAKFKVVGGEMDVREWKGTSDDALWHSNLSNGQNDKNIAKMISHYGFISEDAHQLNDELPAMIDTFTFAHDNKLVHMNLPNQQDFIQNVIKSNRRFYEPEMLADIAARTKLGSTILDIGANIGNHSVYFGLFCGAKKVMSFEPQDEVYDTLSTNIALNHLNHKVTAFQMGLGSYETTAKLGAVDAKNIGMTKLQVSESGGIRIATLDSMVKDEPENSISVIKIDVEGMEMEVLGGAVKTLERHSPVIYAEAGTPPEFEAISVFLSKFGYLATKRFNATATYLFEKQR